MTPHLEPCPFCNQSPDWGRRFDSANVPFYFIEHHCQIVGLISIEWLRDQADIDRHWNHRAASALTSEPPKVPGWYWYRWGEERGVTQYNKLDCETLKQNRYRKWQWSDPLPEPGDIKL